MRFGFALAALLAGMSAVEAVEYRPNDVRPWKEYVEARQEVGGLGLSSPDQAVDHMLLRLGPLPWTFEPDEATPFRTKAVVNRIYTRVEHRSRFGEIVARVEMTYPDVTQGVVSEDLFLFATFRNVSPRFDASKCEYAFAPRGPC